MNQSFHIYLGDATETAACLQHGSFDACLCDPPYGYTAFKSKGRKTSKWETEDVPPIALWESVHAALRPGAFIFAATGARTYHLIASDIATAGFEIVDMFSWLYTSSSATGVKEGYRLKPAVEPYVVARKHRWGTVAASRRRGDLGGILNTSSRFDGHLPSNAGMDDGFAALVDRITGRLVSPFFFCGKAPPSERGEGNDHPTLKPLALTEHIATMMLQKKARRLLVPFSGVGSEMIGALRAGWPEVVGLEREEKYVKIANKRIPKLWKEAA